MKITHYDLFAGIGGFSYALDTVFNNYENKHIFCEWEQFPTAVLKKHWPDAAYYGDIADLIADTDGRRWERSQQGHAERHIGQRSGERSDQTQDLTILTGGFPCQPFSFAGRRKGTADDRYQWPNMFAVIKNVRPDWVIAENVRGLATWNEGMVLETVCADLESEGYEVQPFIVPAVAIGAPHRRDRVWIVAHTINSRQGREKREGITTSDSVPKEHREEDSTPRELERATGEWNYDQFDWQENNWDTDWREVALATCHDGVDDGLPRRLDGATIRGKRTDTISASKHRQERLKAYGNAIVPQVAMEIFKSIKMTVI